MRARTAVLSEAPSVKSEGTIVRHPAANANAATILVGVMSLVPLALLFPVVALCLHTAGGSIWKLLWWAAWCGLAITAFMAMSIVWFGPFRWLPKRMRTKLLATVLIIVPAAILMASMWFLADYSYAYIAEMDAREVTDVRVDGIAAAVAQDGVAMIALQPSAGYIAPPGSVNGSAANSTGSLIRTFTYGCHGVFVPKMCCEAGVTHDFGSNNCQNCSYWRYPDSCPGAELFMVAPLWQDASSMTGSPAAMVYQSNAFLFDTLAARSAWVAAQQATAAPFNTELCRGGRLCGFVPTNAHVQAHWNSWHRDSTASVQEAAVGRHSYAGEPAEVALQRARDLAASRMQSLGRAGEQVPLLWVPTDTHNSFAEWESKLASSERSGDIGTTLLYVAAGLFGASSLGAATWTHGRACFEAAGTTADPSASV